MTEPGSRFINSYEAMALAHRLVDEYDKHEREQNALHKKANPFVAIRPQKHWAAGGMQKDVDTG
jgi:hypothetical protein